MLGEKRVGVEDQVHLDEHAPANFGGLACNSEGGPRDQQRHVKSSRTLTLASVDKRGGGKQRLRQYDPVISRLFGGRESAPRLSGGSPLVPPCRVLKRTNARRRRTCPSGDSPRRRSRFGPRRSTTNKSQKSRMSRIWGKSIATRMSGCQVPLSVCHRNRANTQSVTEIPRMSKRESDRYLFLLLWEEIDACLAGWLAGCRPRWRGFVQPYHTARVSIVLHRPFRKGVLVWVWGCD